MKLFWKRGEVEYELEGFPDAVLDMERIAKSYSTAHPLPVEGVRDGLVSEVGSRDEFGSAAGPASEAEAEEALPERRAGRPRHEPETQRTIEDHEREFHFGQREERG
jgi:hypothetical protein